MRWLQVLCLAGPHSNGTMHFIGAETIWWKKPVNGRCYGSVCILRVMAATSRPGRDRSPWLRGSLDDDEWLFGVRPLGGKRNCKARRSPQRGGREAKPPAKSGSRPPGRNLYSVLREATRNWCRAGQSALHPPRWNRPPDHRGPVVPRSQQSHTAALERSTSGYIADDNSRSSRNPGSWVTYGICLTVCT